MTQSARPAARRTRALWIDALRGSAIVLVMVWHVLTAQSDPRVQQGRLWEASVSLQALRMPVLFLLSGLLLARSLAKSTADYVRGKGVHLLWPFVVWQLLTFALTPNRSAASLHSWGPPNYLWFMLHLLIYFTVALALRRLPPWTMALLALACFVPVSLLVSDTSTAQRLATYAVWFFVGAALGRVLLKARPGVTRARLVAVAVAGGCVWWLHHAAQVDADPEGNAFVFLLLSAPLVALAVGVGLMVGDARWLAPLQWVGRHSLIFYTAHFPVQLAVLHQLRNSRWAGVPAVVAAFVISLLVASLLVAGRDVPVLRSLFRFPGLPRRARRRLTAASSS